MAQRAHTTRSDDASPGHFARGVTLNAEDRTKLTATDFRDQTLKAWAFDKARSGFAWVVINRLRLGRVIDTGGFEGGKQDLREDF